MSSPATVPVVSGNVAGKAKRARSYGKGMTRGAVLTALAIAAVKLGRRDGRWIWQKRPPDR
jgi:hypothetical protein